KQVMDGFFGMGMMVACLKQVGTSDRWSERVNMEVNNSASWSAHSLRTRRGTPSGPGDFRGFTLWDMCVCVCYVGIYVCYFGICVCVCVWCVGVCVWGCGVVVGVCFFVLCVGMCGGERVGGGGGGCGAQG